MAAPSLEQLQALAYAALLDHARRRDPTLATMLRSRASRVGAECTLIPRSPGGAPGMLPFRARPPKTGLPRPDDGDAGDMAAPPPPRPGDGWLRNHRLGGRVTTRAHAASDARRIEVDTRHGLNEAERARLFQPFNRLGRESSGIAARG